MALRVVEKAALSDVGRARQGNEDGNWIVTDLGSTNGVKVNGRRTEEAVLRDGDEVALGLAKFRFELE